jgi:hypothetical protein
MHSRFAERYVDRRHLLGALSASGIFAGICLVWLYRLLGSHSILFKLAGPLLILAGIALQLLKWHVEKRMAARVAAANYRLCPGCLYSLVELGNEGSCPECGRAFSTTGLVAIWRKTCPSLNWDTGTRRSPARRADRS